MGRTCQQPNRYTTGACRDASKALEREREREAALESERRRQIRADLENIDPEDQVEPWARRPISGRCEVREGAGRCGSAGWSVTMALMAGHGCRRGRSAC